MERMKTFLFYNYLSHRKQKLEKELASNSWRVSYQEISLRTRQPGSLRSQVKHRSSGR